MVWAKLKWSEYDKHMYSRNKFHSEALHDFTYPEFQQLQRMFKITDLQLWYTLFSISQYNT
jgi:hypothetical protein